MQVTAEISLKEKFTALIQNALECAQTTIKKSGLNSDNIPRIENFAFESREDPFSRQETLCGCWADLNSQRRGNLVINGDGSLMLEIDLICELPNTDGRWAELVSVWGQNKDNLRSEITLMPTI